MKKRVIIIGGGASGLTAAVFAARQGARVTVLEHSDRVGKKLLSTGNGKCNFSNRRMEAGCYRCSRADFPQKVLSRFGVAKTLEFFKDIGIVPKERAGYLYPYSGQASSVLEAFRYELIRREVKVVTSCEPALISDHDGPYREYRVETSLGSWDGDAVILAAGSKAAPVTGSDGSGYRLAAELGHTVIKPLPALVQLKCAEKFYRRISGVRVDVKLALYEGKRELAQDEGELQLTDYGISGIPVFQVSRFAAQALDRKQRVRAVIDFYPSRSFQETLREIEERALVGGHREMETFFTGWFNKKLGLLFLKLSGIDGQRKAREVTPQERLLLMKLIKEFPTEVTGTNSFQNAQVCCGGVDVREIDPKSLESKKKKGLYLIGELLDVDGICGGYNLQWAWSTGAIAGTHAGR